MPEETDDASNTGQCLVLSCDVAQRRDRQRSGDDRQRASDERATPGGMGRRRFVLVEVQLAVETLYEDGDGEVIERFLAVRS